MSALINPLRPAIRDALRTSSPNWLISNQAINPILALFANGERGCIYRMDASDAHWQDFAATVLASSGDPFARVDDLSGLDNHGTADSLANRPTLVSNGGVWSSSFSGSDNFSLGGIEVGSGTWTIAVAHKRGTSTQGVLFANIDSLINFIGAYVDGDSGSIVGGSQVTLVSAHIDGSPNPSINRDTLHNTLSSFAAIRFEVELSSVWSGDSIIDHGGAGFGFDLDGNTTRLLLIDRALTESEGSAVDEWLSAGFSP